MNEDTAGRVRALVAELHPLSARDLLEDVLCALDPLAWEQWVALGAGRPPGDPAPLWVLLEAVDTALR